MEQTNEVQDKTTIEVSKDIWIWLTTKKIHPRQSFNEVLEEIKRCEG